MLRLSACKLDRMWFIWKIYGVPSVCECAMCDARCAMLLHSKNLLPIQTDRISLVFMFSKFTVAIRIPRITKNTSLILHLYFCFVIISNFFFSLVLSIVLIFIWSSVCVCVAKWHSIPLVKDWTSDKVESEARSRDFKWRWNTATMATARANSNFWVDSFIW